MADAYNEAVNWENRLKAIIEQKYAVEVDLRTAREELRALKASHVPTGVRVVLADGGERTYPDCDWYRDYDMVTIRDKESEAVLAQFTTVAYVERWAPRK